MRLPGLNAESSVYRSRGTYMASRQAILPGGRIVPAYCKTYCRGGECYTECCNCYMGYCDCHSSGPRPI